MYVFALVYLASINKQRNTEDREQGIEFDLSELQCLHSKDMQVTEVKRACARTFYVHVLYSNTFCSMYFINHVISLLHAMIQLTMCVRHMFFVLAIILPGSVDNRR